MSHPTSFPRPPAPLNSARAFLLLLSPVAAVACAGAGAGADSSLSFTSGVNLDDETGDDAGFEADGAVTGGNDEAGDASSGGQAPDLPTPVCGDAVVDAGEGCDDGNSDDTDLCTNACTLAECGDGRVGFGAGELCDDANLSDDDGCDADCQPSTMVQLDAGQHHSCALSRAGAVYCWGQGSFGALGYGDLEDIGDDETPLAIGPVPLGARATQVSAGAKHTCAVLEDGRVRCWGSNLMGRLGTGSWLDYGDDEPASDAPALDFGAPAVEVRAGASHSCTRLQSGAVHCWGSAARGRLGTQSIEDLGDDEFATSGAALELGGPATRLDVNGHSCARIELDQGSVLRCWGEGGAGQLGGGNTQDVGDDEAPGDVSPVFLGLGAEIGEVSVGVAHTCVRIGTVARCWGNGVLAPLGHGELEIIGDDEYPMTIAHVGVRVGEAAQAVAASRTHSCVLLDSGRVRCWGYGSRGSLGPYVPITTPVPPPSSEAPAEFAGDAANDGAAAALSIGELHGCVLTRAGGVRCWGANDKGQLGYGHTEDLADDFGEFSALENIEFF